MPFFFMVCHVQVWPSSFGTHCMRKTGFTNFVTHILSAIRGGLFRTEPKFFDRMLCKPPSHVIHARNIARFFMFCFCSVLCRGIINDTRVNGQRLQQKAIAPKRPYTRNTREAHTQNNNKTHSNYRPNITACCLILFRWFISTKKWFTKVYGAEVHIDFSTTSRRPKANCASIFFSPFYAQSLCTRFHVNFFVRPIPISIWLMTVSWPKLTATTTKINIKRV